MLEWIHTILSLSFLGVALWRYSLGLAGNSGTKPVFGGILNAATISSMVLGCYSLILVAIAIGFAWYAVLSHVRRLKALMDNLSNASAHPLTEGVFNRRAGPALFALLVGAALTAQLAVQAVPMLLSSNS